GCTCAIVFTCDYGTAKSGVGISAMGVLRPDLIMRCSVPVIMAGIIAIYSLVVSVIISGTLGVSMPLAQGFIDLGAGLSVGLSGLAAGFAIGIILILIFAEVLGLYSLIVALIMHTKAGELVGLTRLNNVIIYCYIGIAMLE
ncbi:hypothetical protein BKA83DRAFT_4228685, partial [Pisolithus microcarpus]